MQFAHARNNGLPGFFIRLDKAKLLEEDAFWITDCGNCFHIKITLASFPKTRDAALKVVQKWLS